MAFRTLDCAVSLFTRLRRLLRDANDILYRVSRFADVRTVRRKIAGSLGLFTVFRLALMFRTRFGAIAIRLPPLLYPAVLPSIVQMCDGLAWLPPRFYHCGPSGDLLNAFAEQFEQFISAAFPSSLQAGCGRAAGIRSSALRRGPSSLVNKPWAGAGYVWCALLFVCSNHTWLYDYYADAPSVTKRAAITTYAGVGRGAKSAAVLSSCYASVRAGCWRAEHVPSWRRRHAVWRLAW